jgi:hypothetical protein
LARKLTNEEKENLHMVGTGIWQGTMKNEKNDKCTL